MKITNRPVKLDDLAKKLKVSRVTISKALRDHPDISSATKEKVKALAEKMGYVPNMMARSLSSRKSGVIGVVVPKIAHIFFSTVIEAIYDMAIEYNYEIVLTVSQENAEREKKHILSLLSMKVDGLIISISKETKDTEIFQKVQDLGIPLVFIDRVPDMEGISSVTVDDRGGAFSAVEYGIKKGYTRIAHLGGYHNINIGRERYLGFQDAMKHYGMEINPNWVTLGGFGEEDGYEGFMKIFTKENYPQYVFAVTYPVALGMYAAALELNLSVPDEIEVTCFGKNNASRFLPSVFNFIDQPARELGTEGVKMAVECIDNPDTYVPKNITLKTQFLISDPLFGKGVIL